MIWMTEVDAILIGVLASLRAPMRHEYAVLS
jgi:hypothetical protein